MPLHREKQPPGNEGIKKSLQQIALYAREGMSDENVRAYAIRVMREAGVDRDATSFDRAKALLSAVRRDFVYVNDPRNSEYIQTAKKTIEKFGGGDCDDLTVLILALYGALAQSIGAETNAVAVPAIVAHGYDRGRRTYAHVLMAVWDPRGKRWMYADPTSKDSAFGDWQARPEQQWMMDPMTGKTFCEGPGDVCNTVPPNDPDVEFFAVSGLPKDEKTGKAGAALGDLPDGLDDAMKEQVLSWKANLQNGWETTFAAYHRMVDSFSVADIPLYAEGAKTTMNLLEVTGWTPDFQQQLVNIQEMVKLAGGFLDDAVSGKRKMYYTPDDWAIEALPEDKFRIGGKGPNEVSLETATGEKTNAPALSGWPIVIAAIAGGVALWGIRLWILSVVVDGIRVIIERITELQLHKKYIECSDKHGVEACKSLNTAVGRSHADTLAAESCRKAGGSYDPVTGKCDKPSEWAGLAKLVIGAALVVGGGYAASVVYRDWKEGKLRSGSQKPTPKTLVSKTA